MKNFKTLIFFIGAALIFTSCTKDNTAPCVHDSIREIKNHHLEGKVLQYKYKGQPVYFVVIDECCDFQSTLYDANCNILCISGGIAGGSCPNSITDSLTDEVLIFENP